MKPVEVMRGVALAAEVAGAALVAWPSLVFTAEVTDVPPAPGVRLLSLRVFWVDPPGPGAPAGAGAAGESVDRDGRTIDAESPGLEALTLGAGDARAPGPGSALLVARVVASGADRRTIPGASVEGIPTLDLSLPKVIGTRTTSRYGTVHTVSVARLAALDDPARETIRDLMSLRAMERRAYWEAAFEIAGIRRDEVVWVEAVGPGLIKPSRAWASLLREAVDEPAPPGGPGGRSCIGFGPLSLCLNLSRTIHSLAAGSRLRESSRVRLTRSLWDGGASCGAVVVGRLLDYSTVTFRVRTNGNGARRAGVTYLHPFDLNDALGRARGAKQAEPEPR